MSSATPAVSFMNRHNRVAGLALIAAVFAWLVVPRPAPSPAPTGPESADPWPAVTRTLITVVVVQPEDIDR